MNIWIISDTHFNHTNIIKSCNRPFNDSKEMDETLIKYWNALVKPEDLVIHLGDFAFAGVEYTKQMIKTLNGKIVLILGNHDRSRKPRKWLELGMFRAFDCPQVVSERYLLCHEPSSIDCDNLNYMFGHVHEFVGAMDNPKKNKCCCVDQTNFAPVFFGSSCMTPEEFCDTQFRPATNQEYKMKELFK